MKHRIRAAGLILQNDCIRFVLHQDPSSGIAIWVPPGGGLISIDNSIFDAAKREIFEEK
jgi:ADP-ribose pyrophosphatase YjhB (NUDIX family)